MKFVSLKDGANFIFNGILYTKVMTESTHYNAVEFKNSSKATAFAGGEKCTFVGSVENAIEYCELWG